MKLRGLMFIGQPPTLQVQAAWEALRNLLALPGCSNKAGGGVSTADLSASGLFHHNAAPAFFRRHSHFPQQSNNSSNKNPTYSSQWKQIAERL